MREIFRPRRMWRRRGELRRQLRRRDRRRRRARARDRLLPRQARRQETSPCSSRATSAPAPPGATRRSCAPTTRRPRARASTTPSIKLYERLSAELDFNLLFSQCGHLTLAHSDRAMFVMANRAEVNRLHGIDSRLVDAAEVKRLCPAAERLRGRHVSDHGRAVPPAGRDHPPRRGRLGVSRAAPTAPASRSTPTPRCRVRARQRADRGRADKPRDDQGRVR